ncbi:MAG: 6-bladed beta-propeller [Verrucomicrobiota bacterium]
MNSHHSGRKTLIFAVSLGSLIGAAHAHDLHPEVMTEPATEPYLTGSGPHRFETAPNWGEIPESDKIAFHGGVAVASDGRVFVGSESQQAGILVFDLDGEQIGQWGPGTQNAHGLSLIKDTDGKEHLYAAHTHAKKVVKYDLDGKALQTINHDPDNGVNLKGVTAVTALPSGEVFASTGYGANEVFKFDADGKFVKKAGRKGNAIQDFKNPHGMALDTRYKEPRLLIADREKGRLVHWTTDLEFVGVHATGLRRPCTVAIRGDQSAVAELQGRVTLLNKQGDAIALLGDNPNRELWAKFKVPRSQMYHGVFTAPHGLAFDNDGNIIVQDWNVLGRLTKLDPVPNPKPTKK